MALFKAFSGKRSYLDSEPLVEGHAYFCTDDGTFHIDYKDSNGELKRKPVNDKYITQLLTLQGTVDEILITIPDEYLKQDDFDWNKLPNKPEILTEANVIDIAADKADEALVSAKQYTDDKIAQIPEQTDFTVSCEDSEFDATSSTAAFKRHTLKQLDKIVCVIDVPVDLVVKSGSVKEVTVIDTPYAGAAVGDKYIELVIANQETPIYVPAKDLVDIYKAEANAEVIQLNVDENNIISADIVDKSITEAKLCDDITTKLSKIAENTEAIADCYTKEETDDAITATIEAWWATVPAAEEVEV